MIAVNEAQSASLAVCNLISNASSRNISLIVIIQWQLLAITQACLIKSFTLLVYKLSRSLDTDTKRSSMKKSNTSYSSSIIIVRDFYNNVSCSRFLHHRVITRVNALLSNLFTVANLPLVINSVVKPNIRFFSPPTQHHSLFRNPSPFCGAVCYAVRRWL